jgi:uncharacterized ferredoxin-like protein
MAEEHPPAGPETAGLETVAELMCLAARTAPKARGLDNLYIAILRGQQKSQVTARMREIAAAHDVGFFARDADNCDAAPLVVLVGTKLATLGIPHCGYCGFEDCDACTAAGGRCAYNSGDLGIALGSAAAVAAAHHADNRMMFSFGKSAIEAGVLPPEVRIAVGIPLSGTAKSPFFDRK